MAAKRVFQSIIVIALLAASLAWTGSAFAWSGCSGYVTVNWGDSLSGMAAACGTTVDAIRAANPGMGWQLYAGQVIYMPTGYSSAGYYPPQSGGSTYVVRWGDALGDIAVRYGVSLASLLAVNPQIWNPSLIFPGQVINLPASGNYQPSNNYPPTYYPPSYYPPTYYPPAYYPPTSYPPPPVSSDFSVLKVTFGHGLLVRTGPGKNFSEIKSPSRFRRKEFHLVV